MLPWNGVDVDDIERDDATQVGLAPTHLAADVGGDDFDRDPSTTVLIAVEDSESESVSVVRVAQAAQAADAASLGDATALGEVGDPASAIIAAAHQHGVDVVVIGSHDRPWFAKLFTGSVGDGVLRDADLPVLVVR